MFTAGQTPGTITAMGVKERGHHKEGGRHDVSGYKAAEQNRWGRAYGSGLRHAAEREARW
jgi:hypothetical protein